MGEKEEILTYLMLVLEDFRKFAPILCFREIC